MLYVYLFKQKKIGYNKTFIMRHVSFFHEIFDLKSEQMLKDNIYNYMAWVQYELLGGDAKHNLFENFGHIGRIVLA